MRIRPQVRRARPGGAAAGFLPAAPATSSTPPRGVEHPAGGRADAPVLVRAIRETPAGELGVARPSGLAWSPRLGTLLVAEGRRVLRVARGPAVGIARVAAHRDGARWPSARERRESYLAGSDLVTYAAGSLRRARPAGPGRTAHVRGGTCAAPPTTPRAGWWSSTVRLWCRRGRGRSRRPHRRAGSGRSRPRRADPWPGRNVLFTYDRDTRMLVGIGRDGQGRPALRPAPGRVRAVTGLAIAPSADRTDHRSTKSLYLTDAGAAGRRDGSSRSPWRPRPPAAVAAAVTAIRRAVGADLGVLPPEPRPVRHRLPAGPRPVRHQRRRGRGDDDLRRGQPVRDHQGRGADQERGLPALVRRADRCGLQPGHPQLLVCDDSKREMYHVSPGPDTRYGSSDDTITHFDTGAGQRRPRGRDLGPGHRLGLDDRRGQRPGLPLSTRPGRHVRDGGRPAQQLRRGRLRRRGSRRHRLRLRPRHPGRPATTRPTRSTSSTAAERCSTPSHDRRQHAQGGRHRDRPGSANPGVRNYYIVDRGVDNDNHPDENDGKLYELAANLPPVGPAPTSRRWSQRDPTRR